MGGALKVNDVLIELDDGNRRAVFIRVRYVFFGRDVTDGVIKQFGCGGDPFLRKRDPCANSRELNSFLVLLFHKSKDNTVGPALS